MDKGQDDGDNEYKAFSSAVKIVASWEKVVHVLKGGIPVPDVVEIFPTNYCDMDCGHCRSKESHGKRSEHMDIKTLENLLIELKGEVHNIEFSGGGEPMVHPQIDDIFDMLKTHEFRYGMISNGYRFVRHPETIKKALQCADWIRLSVDGFTDETYREVHGRKNLSYKALKDAISGLVEQSGDIPTIGLKMLMSNLNYKEAGLAIQESKELGVDYLQLKFLGYPDDLVLGNAEAVSLKKDIEKQISSANSKDFFVELIPELKGNSHDYQSCPASFLHAMVDWDGSMYLCAFFEGRKEQMRFGNIKEGGFFKNWYSPRHIQVYESIDHSSCFPSCPMLRYNPLVDFIRKQHHMIKYI